MTIHVASMDSPAAGVARLDGLSGTVAVLAGLDRPQAAEAFELYRAQSSRVAAGATFDAAALRVTHGGTILQFAWETNIAIGQDHLWSVVWTELVIEDRLIPSWDLVQAFEFIIKAKKAG